MSSTMFKDIKCACGEVFQAELFSSINVQNDMHMKDVILAGELNIVKCPRCMEMFYAEHFVLYLDPANELLAFVYPSCLRNDRENCLKKMTEDFSRAQAAAGEGKKLAFEPSMFFGMEELLELLHFEEIQADEISILESIKDDLKLRLVRFNRGEARKNRMPYLLPYIAESGIPDAEKVIRGLDKLLKFMPDLEIYASARGRIGQDRSLIEGREMICS